MDDNTNLNPLYDPATDNAAIADDVQARINKPLKDASGLSPEDKEFLDLIMRLVKEGKIELHTPSSLINHTVYDNISDEARGKADQNTVTMLARIRDINDLMTHHPEVTFQVQNLVHQLRLQKERLEEAGGDLFII